jgi:hypothetical protein
LFVKRQSDVKPLLKKYQNKFNIMTVITVLIVGKESKVDKQMFDLGFLYALYSIVLG